MRDFESQIKVFKAWRKTFDFICSELTRRELASVCIKAGVSMPTINLWKKGAMPSMSSWNALIEAAHIELSKKCITSGLKL